MMTCAASFGSISSPLRSLTRICLRAISVSFSFFRERFYLSSVRQYSVRQRIRQTSEKVMPICPIIRSGLRLPSQKLLQHVLGQACNVVLVLVVREAARVTDGADRE